MIDDITEQPKLELVAQKKICDELVSIPIHSDYSYFNKLLLLLGTLSKERISIDRKTQIDFMNENFSGAKLSVRITTLNINDFIVLSYLNEIAKKNNSHIISTSLYDIATHIYSKPNGDEYKMIRDSLMALKDSNMRLKWEDKDYKNKEKTEKREVIFNFINEIYFENYEKQTGKIIIWLSENYIRDILGDKKRLVIFNRKILTSIRSAVGRQILLYLSCLSFIDKISIDKIKKNINTDMQYKHFKQLIISLIPKLNKALNVNIVIDKFNNINFNRGKKAPILIFDHSEPNTFDHTEPIFDHSEPNTFDQTRPTFDQTRPIIDQTRPFIDQTRPIIDQTRPDDFSNPLVSKS